MKWLLAWPVFLVVGILMMGALMATGKPAAITPTVAGGGSGVPAVWDPGGFMPDAVLYNPRTMNAAQIQTFLDGHPCSGACLRNTQYAWPSAGGTWCKPVAAGAGSFAQMLETVSLACDINPQVSLAMIEKESRGLDRPPPAALTGFACPDSGPGGSAACAGDKAGVWNQVWGMVQSFARLRVDPSKVNYLEGRSYQVYWNIAESGCGKTPVYVKNRATATLLTYTPYVPNAASLAAYPGEGDACSSYGNRNVWRLMQAWFGSGSAPVVHNGVQVQLPDSPHVAEALRGKVIQAPTPQVAQAISAGLGMLGTDYSWGGGDANGPSYGVCEGGVTANACHVRGFDCAGLMLYIWAQAGLDAPRNSQAQARSGQQMPWAQRQTGDMIGYPGHVAMYLITVDGQDYMLEAPNTGNFVRVARVRPAHYAAVARIWGGGSDVLR